MAYTTESLQKTKLILGLPGYRDNKLKIVIQYFSS
jgi:hypothetical protein